MQFNTRWPVRAVGSASELFLHNLGQDMLVECQICNQLLKSAVLFAKLAQLALLRRAQIGVLLTPDIERGPSDPEPAANFLDRRPLFRLLQRVGNLLPVPSESRARHRPLLFVLEGRNSHFGSVLICPHSAAECQSV